MSADATFSGRRIAGLYFSGSEIRDLLVAWLALGVAFTLFFVGGSGGIGRILAAGVVPPLLVALATAGVAFLLHEVAHKVVAVHYDQVAEFRADNSMLFLAVMSSLLGFIFAAPGAVHHRGRLTAREHGHIALAGPVVNLGLMVAFAPILFVGGLVGSPIVSLVGARGVAINAFLAAFNLVPYGPLDGKTVMNWSKPVWAAVFVPSVLLALGLVFVGGLGFGGPF
ncbi:metalloprotease [Halorubrum sp. GN11_10-6_MGM]|uniref:metalloprotease n=1 Tax=Halorubrum sp. GN11_10-6_MGM TaxID=2518112 RepID=UPI0010F6074A|nr:metalloprotease [Halorubrum sp. GN11_10-6_MGM]TKX74880.1 metalloprotease [Halorubrum sp. GN11_10-6_MGM]